MALEVYTAGRPAVPLRAWLSSILLLASVCGLAGWMSWSRSGESLGARVEPQDWAISFRPPRRFEPVAFDPSAGVYAIFYRTTTASGGVAELAFRRMKVPRQSDAGEVCDLLLRPHGSIFLAVFAPPAQRTLEKLGPLDALQVHQPAIPMIVRALPLPDGSAYAVSLRAVEGPLDESLYHAFDLACRSVDFKLSSGAVP